MKAWIRDELGPEAALAERLREDADTLLRVPALIRRLEEQFPPRGGAPEPPPLPEIELMWERRERARRGRLGQVSAVRAGRRRGSARRAGARLGLACDFLDRMVRQYAPGDHQQDDVERLDRHRQRRNRDSRRGSPD